MRDLGQQVRTFREQKGITLNAYAQQLGVSPGYLSNLETGKTDTIHLPLLEHLIKELNLDLTKDENANTYDDVDIRIQKVHYLLRNLMSVNPEAVDYLLRSIEQGIDFFKQTTAQSSVLPKK